MTSLVLASTSQIRRQIMTGAGLDFTVKTTAVDESEIKQAMLEDGASPEEIAKALAQAKSVGVSKTEAGMVIGADQIMVMDGQIFDKPKTLDEARRRLKFMAGKTHYLIGAVIISQGGEPIWHHMAKTKLTMRAFSDDFLDHYVNMEGQALLKSVGAYRFEGPGAQLFSHVEGDFFSILGLSLLPILNFLREQDQILS